jgi:alkylation response protein AidB-like acyl-CoA dehydrogenase
MQQLPMEDSADEEQRLLRDGARRLLEARSPVAALRGLRDRNDAAGFSRPLWTEVAELGWSGILVPEALGGADLGHAAAAIVAEECGRTLAALPFLSTAVTGVTALVQGGSPQQQGRILPRVAAGTCLLALCVDERPRHAPGAISTVAERTDGGYRLSGRKIFALDGHVADFLIVSARIGGPQREGAGNAALFLVDAAAAGVRIERTILLDSRNAADIRLTAVEIGAEGRLGCGADGAALLDSVLDAGRAALAAELVGLARECLRRTVLHLCERRQFGRRIGEFQALQHRLAHLFCEIELAASLVRAAALAVREGRQNRPILVSAAKAKAAEAATLAANEAIQMHGGIGMTDELDIGLFVKRIRGASETYGDLAFHRDRVARLHGF